MIKTRKQHPMYGKDHTHLSKKDKAQKLCSICVGAGVINKCLTPCDHCEEYCEAMVQCHKCKGEGVI